MLKKLFVITVLSSLTVLAVCGAEKIKTVSVGEIMAKARRGEDLTVVFFGGSLTWGANATDPNLTSWRGKTMQMLKKRYPRVRWSFYDAAIGGTGSALGVFRLERDVFRRNPDLVILDFTLNDNLFGREKGFSDSNNQSYEMILRKCLERKIAVLPVFLTARRYTESKDLSAYKRRLQHIELFKKYNLDYADVLGTVNRAYRAGKLDTDKMWPAEFFDNTHPHDFGYAVYAEYFAGEWERIERAPLGKPRFPGKPLTGNGFNYISRIELAGLKRSGWVSRSPYIVADSYDWTASRWIDKTAVYSNAVQVKAVKWKSKGGKLKPFTFSFRAERIALMVETIPESVKFSISLDGKAPRKVNFRSVKRSQFHHLTLAQGLDPDKTHTIKVIPHQTDVNVPGVMRWSSLLLNSSKPTNLEWK